MPLPVCDVSMIPKKLPGLDPGWKAVFGKDHAQPKSERPLHLSAIADGPEMLVDAEGDEDEFRNDAGRQYPDQDTDETAHHHEQAANGFTAIIHSPAKR